MLETEDERRRLHNAIQELRGNVRVFCRLRPTSEADQGFTAIDHSPEHNPDTVKITAPAAGDRGELRELAFSFDKVRQPNLTSLS